MFLLLEKTTCPILHLTRGTQQLAASAGGVKWQSQDDIHPCDIWEASLRPPGPFPHRAAVHDSPGNGSCWDLPEHPGLHLRALHTGAQGALVPTNALGVQMQEGPRT